MSVNEYMLAWLDGSSDVRKDLDADTSRAREAYQRGYRAGRAAFLAAENAERERLVNECPRCGSYSWRVVGPMRQRMCSNCQAVRDGGG